jgi:hypothetical protein
MEAWHFREISFVQARISRIFSIAGAAIACAVLTACNGGNGSTTSVPVANAPISNTAQTQSSLLPAVGSVPAATLPSAQLTDAASAALAAFAPNYFGYVSWFWGDQKTWTINCDKPFYFPPNTCLVAHAQSGAAQLDGPPLAAGLFVAISAASSSSQSNGLIVQSFRTSKTPFAAAPLPNGYVGPSPTPAPTPTPAFDKTYLGYVSYYWGDQKLWTINCDKPFYFPPKTCLVAHVQSGAKQIDGPPLAAGIFVQIFDTTKTSSASNGLIVTSFRTSKIPFYGSPVPNGYTGPTQPIPSDPPITLPTVAPTTTPTVGPTATPTAKPTGAPTPKPTATPTATPPPVAGSVYPPEWPAWTSASVFLQSLDFRNPGSHIASWSSRALNEYNVNHNGMGSWTTFTPLMIGNANDGSTPIYIAQNSDPAYKIHCTMYNCPSLEGLVIHVPTPYVVEHNGGGDGHLAVISPDKTKVYSFYQTRQPSGSTINIASGMTLPTNGSGWSVVYGGASNAAQASFVAGTVTAYDLLRGQINHALIVAAPCESGKVYPTIADPDGPCASGNGAPMGGHLWLNMTDAQIDAQGMPRTKVIIAKALAHYGAYIMDSAGANAWSIHRDGAAAPASAVARWTSLKATVLGGSDVWLTDGWPSAVVNSFRFLDPCVAQMTC